MRTVPLLLMVSACAADTGFTTGEKTEVVQEGSGDIRVSPEEILLEDLAYDPPVDKAVDLLISNVGDATLQVFSIEIVENPTTDTSPNGVLFIEEIGQLELPSDSERSVAVGARLLEATAVEGRVRVNSGDADTPDIYIPVIVRPVGWEPVDSGG